MSTLKSSKKTYVDSLSEESDSDSGSDTTLEDIELLPKWNFGHPLQRMARVEDVNAHPDFFRYRFSTSGSDSESSSTDSSTSYDIDFEALVDDFLVEQPFQLTESRNLIMVEPSSDGASDALMIKCLPQSSCELSILLLLNQDEARLDPWNPVPHILSVIEREDRTFVCMERLHPYNHPPFQTVAHYIDFFKQVLEGLTFLHEHNVAQLSCTDPDTLMIDIGAGSRSSLAHFDRTKYPVRYYCTDFSHAKKLDSHHDAYQYFMQDVHDCGMMIDRLLVHIPRVAPKLKSLVKAMTTGGFGADDSRKLFEALCKSLEAAVFDTPVVNDT